MPEQDDPPRPAGRARLIAGVAVVAALAVTVVVVLVSVGGGGASGGHPSPLASAGRQLTRDPDTRPLSVPSQPTWRGGAGGSLSWVDGAQIVGDRVLVWGRTAAEKDQVSDDLAVAEVATGRPDWIWHQQQPRRTADGRYLFLDTFNVTNYAAVVGTGASALVLTQYELSSCPSDPPCAASGSTDERGLMALDAATGAVRWRAPVLPSAPIRTPRGETLNESTPWLVATDARTAVIGVENADPPRFDWSVRSTVVIDVATGTVRWRRDGEWPLRMTGGSVLTERSLVAKPPRSGDPDDLGFAVDITARDAGTGTVRWHTANRYRSAGLLGAAGGVALLWDSTAANVPTPDPFAAPKASGRYELVDAGTGTVRASMAAYTPSTLGADDAPCEDQRPPDPTLLACVVLPDPTSRLSALLSGSGRLWTARSGQITLSPPLHDAGRGRLQVAGGYVLAEQGNGPSWTVLDRAGKKLAGFSGTVLALSDGYAVVENGDDGRNGYGVYRLGR